MKEKILTELRKAGDGYVSGTALCSLLGISRQAVWKNNLAAFGHPKAFALSEEGFQWIGDYEITVDEVLGGIAPKANKMELAKQMLRELAETHSAVLSNEIFDRADELGISKRTLENAKKELGIRARKINNAWYWELDKVKQE